MPEFVVAPFFEPPKDRVELPVRISLHLTIDRDVSGIADLFRQVSGVKDELRLEVGVFLDLGQEAEIDTDAVILQNLIDEAGVAGFVTAHIGKQLANIRVCDPLLNLRVEHAAGEFGSQRADQEILELLAKFFRQVIKILLEFVCLHECLRL